MAEPRVIRLQAATDRGAPVRFRMRAMCEPKSPYSLQAAALGEGIGVNLKNAYADD